MTQNVEIFKALRIIKIMLKTKKTPNTLHTGCFISPFATTQTSRTQIESSCTFSWLRLKVAACLFFSCLLFKFLLSVIPALRLSNF